MVYKMKVITVKQKPSLYKQVLFWIKISNKGLKKTPRKLLPPIQ